MVSPDYTGQYYDSEFDQYYLRARQYEPYLGIFTANDPVDGKYQEPRTLHEYLYCTNDPINKLDPWGEFAYVVGGSASGNFNLRSVASDIFRDAPLWKSAPALVAAPALSQILAYYLVELPLMTVGGSLGGGITGGAGIAGAKDTRQTGFWDGWSIGTTWWRAGGPSLSTGSSISGSGTLDIGLSMNAQHVKHLIGPYWEVGGSATLPWGGYTAGFSYSRSRDINPDTGTYIDLWTFSPIGKGKSSGAEIHGYFGNMWVKPWW